MATNKKILEAMEPKKAIDVLVGEMIRGERSICSVNGKLKKSGKVSVKTIGLTLAPATDSVPFGGRDMCPMAGECAKACLKYSGHNVLAYNRLVQIARTIAYTSEAKLFLAQVEREVLSHIRYCEKRDVVPAMRANVMSDQIKLSRHFAKRFPELRVYDYTKIVKSLRSSANPTHLHLTLSRDERNERQALELLNEGYNVAVVFDSQSLPDIWKGYPVIDGDDHDVRFLDAPGHVVGLRLKGTKEAKKAAIDSGFAVSVRSALRIVA